MTPHLAQVCLICLCWCSSSGASMFFAFVGVPHLADCRSWCSCRWLSSQAITNYQQSACTIARARHVVGVANAANPKHNTQQRQSAQTSVLHPAQVYSLPPIWRKYVWRKYSLPHLAQVCISPFWRKFVLAQVFPTPIWRKYILAQVFPTQSLNPNANFVGSLDASLILPVYNRI